MYESVMILIPHKVMLMLFQSVPLILYTHNFLIPHHVPAIKASNNQIEKSCFSELMVARGEGEGEQIVREFWIDIYTLVYLKWITSKNIPYNTGNFAQYYVLT